MILKVLVLSKRKFDFTTGNDRVQGVKISYLTDDKDMDDVKGYSPFILNGNVEIDESFTELPGMYDLNFVQKIGKNNKPELFLKSAKLVSPIDFGKFWKA